MVFYSKEEYEVARENGMKEVDLTESSRYQSLFVLEDLQNKDSEVVFVDPRDASVYGKALETFEPVGESSWFRKLVQSIFVGSTLLGTLRKTIVLEDGMIVSVVAQANPLVSQGDALITMGLSMDNQSGSESLSSISHLVPSMKLSSVLLSRPIDSRVPFSIKIGLMPFLTSTTIGKHVVSLFERKDMLIQPLNTVIMKKLGLVLCLGAVVFGTLHLYLPSSISFRSTHAVTLRAYTDVCKSGKHEILTFRVESRAGERVTREMAIDFLLSWKLISSNEVPFALVSSGHVLHLKFVRVVDESSRPGSRGLAHTVTQKTFKTLMYVGLFCGSICLVDALSSRLSVASQNLFESINLPIAVSSVWQRLSLPSMPVSVVSSTLLPSLSS